MKYSFKFYKPFLLLSIFFSFSFVPPEVSFKPRFFGEFKIKKKINYYDSLSHVTTYEAMTHLYNDSINYSQSWRASQHGQVYYNNIPLSYNSAVRTYIDTAVRKTNQGINWSLANSGICSFSTTLMDTFPSFAFKNCLSSSLCKSQNFVIYINQAKYVDEVEVTMYDGQFKSSLPYYRRLPCAGLNQIVIPKQHLTTLTGQGVIVTVSLIKYEFKILSGKRFRFEKRFDFVRPMPLVN